MFSDALSRSEAMREALSRFTESLFAQVQQTAACNAQHRLDERMARWLLTLHDRADGDRVRLTQSDIAGMLGVRRATVSEVGSEIEGQLSVITRCAPLPERFAGNGASNGSATLERHAVHH